MNKLLGVEGGQPFYADDLLFMQQNAMDAMKGVVSSVGMGQVNVILSGCKITVGSVVSGRHEVKWTSGFLAMDGEVYPVKAGTVNVQQGYSDLYWVVKREAYEVRDFENGTQNKVYESGEAVVSASYVVGETYVEVRKMYDFKGSFDKYVTKRTSKDIVHSVSSPDKISVSCVLHEDNSGFAICEVNVSVKTRTEMVNNALFGYVSTPIFEASSTVVFGISKIYVFRMWNGGAFLYNADGSAVSALDQGTFSVNLIIKR